MPNTDGAVTGSAGGAGASGGVGMVSLDVFRGSTMAAMVIVNNPGDWGSVYWPLEHLVEMTGFGPWIYAHVFRPFAPPRTASVAYAFANLAVLFVLLAWMYRRRWFLRV